jgi:adenosylcobinamide-GDP ribazoletransferase
LEFHGIAGWAPTIGLLIGGLLALLDAGLEQLGMAILTRSAIVIVAAIGITGGLHLDGAIDAADGLAVLDPKRRLEVMADSRTGAFGVMAAVSLLLLKTVALSELSSDRAFCLMLVAGWGRWGQLAAIVLYPYLKPEGKGAFHKAAVRSFWNSIPGLLVLLSLTGGWVFLNPHQWAIGVATVLGGGTIALLTGAWFHYKLGGHTGDTYGAVVEWTEALLLCWLVIFI